MIERLTGVVMACCAMSVTAGEIYGGADFMQTTYSEDGVSEDAKNTVLRARIGNQINKNFAIEGFFGVGVGSDSVSVPGGSVDVEIDHIVGATLKGLVPVSESFSLFGLLGYTKGKATFSSGGFSASESESDLSLGFGINFLVSPTFCLQATYEQIADKSNFDVSGLSVGMSVAF